MQRTTSQGSGAELESAMETLNISRDQAQESSRGSDQHRAPKVSHEEDVWYLKSIDFTSPSGETHTYNVITQNYNGCVVHP